MILELRSFKDTLVNAIESSSKVFIVGHNNPDYDAIGSAMGLQALATALGEQAYIVYDEDETLDSKVKSIIENNKEQSKIIGISEYKKIMDSESILIVTDTNRSYRVCVKEDLMKFSKVFIVDHHDLDPNTSIKSLYSYVNTEKSSSSEIVYEMILSENKQRVAEKQPQISITPNVATALLAGITLDTKRFKRNTTGRTFQISALLQRKKADYKYINNVLFTENFEDYKRVSNLVVNGPIFRKYLLEENEDEKCISFNLNRRKNKTTYSTIDVAKAADAMLKFADTTFALGCTGKNQVTISARSNDTENGIILDVGEVLMQLDKDRCGGNATSAGGLIPIGEDGFTKIKEVESEIMKIVNKQLRLQNYKRI